MNDIQKFFSIITVTLDNRAGLARTMQSVQAQSCRDYEWIVIDGGSEDGSVEMLENSAARWISERDGGIYDAMNKGLERARGRYVMFLNAGDTLAHDQTLETIKVMNQGQSSPPDFIYGDALEAQHYKRARAHEKLAAGMFTHHQAMFYRRSTLGALRYDTGYKIAADYDFTCRFLALANRVLYAPLPICVFEQGGVSQRQARLGRREQVFIRKGLGLLPLPGNVALYVAQSAVWSLRAIMPGVYWRLKA